MGEKPKLFIGAFLITALFLAIAMVSTVLAVRPRLPDPAASEDAAFVYRPTADDTLTLLAVGLTDNRPSDFLLIRYNPQHEQIPLILLPPNTALSGTTLAAFYTEKGPEALKQALSRALSIQIDRYATLGDTPFLQIASKVGTVTGELPYDIAYATPDGPVRFSAGKQKLDGQALLQLFAAPQLCADPVEKNALLGTLIADGINQNISVGSQKRASTLFGIAINLVKTDINSADFELRRQSAEYLAAEQRTYAGVLPLKGELSSGIFHPSEETVALLPRYFQPLA